MLRAVSGYNSGAVGITGGTIAGTTISSSSVNGIAAAAFTDGRRLLATIRSANMNVTTDQALTILGTSKYMIDAILVTNASISLTTAAGGIYPSASKGGTAIVAAAQTYSALSSHTVVLPLTLAVTDTLQSTATLYFALTTPQGAAATADIYVFGYDLT